MRYWEEQDGSIFHDERNKKWKEKETALTKEKNGEDKRRRECD